MTYKKSAEQKRQKTISMLVHKMKIAQEKHIAFNGPLVTRKTPIVGVYKGGC